MVRLSDEFIAQVKSANDIVDIFRTYADVKKHGRVYTCCCPFHSEKTPSCTIYPESDSFYCFGCHVGGDVIKFTMLTDNVNYVEDVQILAQRSGIPMPVQSPEDVRISDIRDKCYEINRETANFCYQNLLTGSDKAGLQFLKSYGISPETVRKYALGYVPDDWQFLHHYLRNKGFSDKELEFSGLFRKNSNQKLYDYFRNSILFPVVDFRGNVIAFGGVSIENLAHMYTDNTPVSDRKELIFSLNFAKKESDVNFMILAENYFHAVLLYQAGFSNVIAVPNIMTRSHVKKLSQYTKKVVFIQSQASHFGDSQTVQNLFSEAEMQMKILNLPETSDSVEFLRNYGAEAFRKKFSHTGDAVQNALQEAWNAGSEQNQFSVIQQTAMILKKINDPLERELYLSEASQKLQLSPEQLQAQIDKLSGHIPVKGHQSASRSLTPEELNSRPRKQEIS